MVSERASPAVDLVDVHVHEELVRWLVQNGHLLGSEKGGATSSWVFRGFSLVGG